MSGQLEVGEAVFGELCRKHSPSQTLSNLSELTQAEDSQFRNSCQAPVFSNLTLHSLLTCDGS